MTQLEYWIKASALFDPQFAKLNTSSSTLSGPNTFICLILIFVMILVLWWDISDQSFDLVAGSRA